MKRALLPDSRHHAVKVQIIELLCGRTEKEGYGYSIQRKHTVVVT